MRTGNDFIPLALFCILILAAAAILAVAMYLRYKKRELQHRERMVALEKGVALPVIQDVASDSGAWTSRTMLLRGLVWLFSGLSITVFLFVMSVSAGREVPAAVRVFDANQAKARGASDDEVRLIMNDKEQRGIPRGLALLGLIPAGVGLAYLITYRTERRALTG